jgi:hypothetical protein
VRFSRLKESPAEAELCRSVDGTDLPRAGCLTERLSHWAPGRNTSMKRLIVMTSVFALGLGTAAFAQSGSGSSAGAGSMGSSTGGGASSSSGTMGGPNAAGTQMGSPGTMNGGPTISAPVNTGSQGDSMSKGPPASGAPSSSTLVPAAPNTPPKSNPGPTQPSN